MLRRTRQVLAPFLAACASASAVIFVPGAAEAATSGTVKVGSSLTVRAAPTSASAKVGSLRNKAKVSIACRVNGQYVKGTVRSTAQWDRLTSGRYISHAYVQTSVAVPACAESTPAPTPPASGPSAPSGPLTTVSNAAFIAAAAAPAQASQREYRVPASVTIAQAILESGWGKSGLANVDRNYFGMKCFGNPGGIATTCHDYLTTECDATKCWQLVDSFRVYNSVTDSFRDHGRQLATLSRYAPAFAYANDPNRFAAEVHRGGYATDPEYTNKLVRIMTNHNLYQYDVA
jgi:flagellum-specific peptidoglycan hydrolase FlgJ